MFGISTTAPLNSVQQRSDPAVDFNFWLGRKYALLQQQADATTKNADSTAIASGAAANLDNTRAGLMPAESAATVKKMGAETGLIGEQTKVIGPEALARIAQMNAGAGLDNVNAAVITRKGLTEQPIMDESIRNVLGMRNAPSLTGLAPFRLGGLLGT